MSEPLHTPAAPPPPPAGGGRPGNPWDRRDQLGLVAAFIENLKLFVTSPGRAYAETREKGDFAGPLIFAIIVGWISVAISQVWNMMLGSSMVSMLGPELRDTLGPMMVGSTMGLLIQLLITPIYIVIGLFIYCAILHACLAIVGGLSDSQAGFEGTFRVLSFAVVAQLGQVIPLFGWLVSLVWGIVLAVIGFTSLHRTTQGKAIVAILIPYVLCCICVVFGVVMFGASMAALFASQ